jgi:hypothetical protein
MTITSYQLHPQRALDFADVADYAHLKTWKQPAHIMDWSPIAVTLQDKATLADIMGLHHMMIWSQDVLDTLAPHVEGVIQALPVTLNSTPYYAIHITHALDCLDTEASQFRRFKNRNIGVEAYVLRGDCVGDTPIFTVPDDGYSAIFVSSALKQVIEDAQWAGVSFEVVTTSRQA